ncbi:UNVERIFIED_CONTAM: hypothetical protein K2H54_039174 [Gekko kuhli]
MWGGAALQEALLRKPFPALMFNTSSILKSTQKQNQEPVKLGQDGHPFLSCIHYLAKLHMKLFISFVGCWSLIHPKEYLLRMP